eukprot:Opistho-1_new@32852
MLSFNNRLDVLETAPDLLHIATMLVASGPLLMRASVHGLVVNIVQSLCTTLPNLPEDVSRTLRLQLAEFAQPKYHLLFGISSAGGSAATAAFDIAHARTEKGLERISLNSAETIVGAFADIVDAIAPHLPPNRAWHARWLDLTLRTALQPNPALQPRAFVALGVLARTVDDELVSKALRTLGDVLNWGSVDPDLVSSILMCLTRMLALLPKESRFHAIIFWVAITIAQMGDQQAFPVALSLLEATLRTSDGLGLFERAPLETILLAARQPFEAVCAKIEATVGLSFKTDFAFATATSIVKGFKHPMPTTKGLTSRVLACLVDIRRRTGASGSGGASTSAPSEQHRVIPQTLGYLAVGLPVSTDLRQVALPMSSESEQYRAILAACGDATTALLLLVTSVNMLSSVESDAQKLFIYGLLAEAASVHRDIFPAIHDILVPKINNVVGSTSDIATLEAVQAIVYSVVRESTTPAASAVKRPKISLVADVGFPTLMDPASIEQPKKATRDACARLCSELVAQAIK